MKRYLPLVILIALILGARACAGDCVDGCRAADIMDQKELFDDIREFLRTARTGLEKLQSVPDKLGLAAYYAGAKDGALGAAVGLVVIYLAYMHRKAS